MTTTFYRKEGRKYVPVSDYDSHLTDAYPYGSHLVTVKRGSTGRVYNIDPAFAPMIAAAKYAKDDMVKVFMEASAPTPESELTEEELKAWAVFKEAMGIDVLRIKYASANEVIDAGLAAMQEEADKMLQYPAVKEAWDHFMFMCQLTKNFEGTQ
jgi:hypothetical protein